jgi:hypothetical protein
MTTVDHVTCCCTETRETIQRLEAAYGAACQRLDDEDAEWDARAAIERARGAK